MEIGLKLRTFFFNIFAYSVNKYFLGACLLCTSHCVRWWCISLRYAMSCGGDRPVFFQGSSPKKQVVPVRSTKRRWQFHTPHLPREHCDSPCSPIGVAPSNSSLEGNLSKLISLYTSPCFIPSFGEMRWLGWGECITVSLQKLSWSMLQKSPCKRGSHFSDDLSGF